MEICLIAAMAHNNVIGKDNTMPWHLKEDLQHFKKVTMGCPIVMGRKTFDSIGRALPGRENIILTRDKNYQVDGVTICHSREDLLEYLKENSIPKVFIIGGSQIYRMFLDVADKLYLTKIDLSVEGDTHFPEFDAKDYEIIETERGVAEATPHLPFEFQTLRKLSESRP